MVLVIIIIIIMIAIIVVIIITDRNNVNNVNNVNRNRPRTEGPPSLEKRKGVAPEHTCHILPFQPILWNRCFLSKSVKSAQNSPKSISEWGRIWQVWLSRASSVYGQLSKVNTVSSKSLNSGLWRVEYGKRAETAVRPADHQFSANSYRWFKFQVKFSNCH